MAFEMSEHIQCEQCGSQLRSPDEVCSNCSKTLDADYVTPVPPSAYRSTGHALASVFGRLLVGTIIWIVIVAFLFLSAIPYGGGSGFMSVVLVLATIGIPIWVLLPLRDIKNK